MAGNDGTTTELFTGWSSVVHQPCEEPEDAELPSTVDMAAFTTGLSCETNNTSQNNDNSDTDSESEIDSSNSGTDASQSCSQSDSSDSDSSSSSQQSSSRTPSPEFSVTSSQTNGLRLTIAQVRKSPTLSIEKPTKCTKSATSSSSQCSSDTDSDSDTSNKSHVPVNKVCTVKSAKDNIKKPNNNVPTTRLRRTIVDKKENEKNVRGTKGSPTKTTNNNKVKTRQRRTRKMASLPLQRGSIYSSSDTDDSDADSVMLASCSLQEIRDEDLAAILPDQKECDAFNEFDNVQNKNSPSLQTGDLSGCSDMELPQQAVNALIQRTTESSSESESPHPLPNLSANSLLQQFDAQTQMLNTQPSQIFNIKGSSSSEKSQNAQETGENGKNGKIANGEEKRRPRGRPKKKAQQENAEYCTNPNVSPDSGIQNSPERHVSSPEPTIQSPTKLKQNKSTIKCDKTAKLNRLVCTNADRVLYPPRRKVGRPPNQRKGPGRPPKQQKQVDSNDNKQQAIKKPQQQQQRGVLTVKNKLDVKNKYTTLKLMHSSKHKKHKKCKFKILKPLSNTTVDPKLTIEVEKLVNDFVKYCTITQQPIIDNNASKKENVPELMKTLKKVSKKRKTTDEKKKKNQQVNKVNSNEQRLPLKKRHYHLSVKIDEELVDEKTKNTAKANIKCNNNNNEYEVKESNGGSGGGGGSVSVGGSKNHIDEAIEACINRFNDDDKSKEQQIEVKEEKLSSITTPKKRHRLEISSPQEEPPNLEEDKTKITVETFINELKIKRNLVPTKSENEETVQQQKVEEKPKTIELKKKIRKRRAINRTGFPTVKKKKKKLPPIEPIIETKPPCDRVPKEGEEYMKFMERSEDIPESPTKWEVMSECDSLPQDERIDYEEEMKLERKQNDSSPTASILSEKMKLDDDLDEISLESSIERLRSRLDKKRKRSNNNCFDLNGYPKRRIRDDVSPASSIEPIVDRLIRDERASTSGDEKKSRKAPRWRKKYLVAGLFSDYYKEDDDKRQENNVKSSRLVYNPSEHPYGLLPPPYHCGKYLRCRKLPFQLPYDLWWQHTHNQLPGRDVVPSWNYRKIRTNVYNVKITTGACEPQSCNCKQTPNNSHCGDDCINRLVLSECPASHRCQNQRIQRHEWAPGLEKFMTDSKGWGVRTKLPIKNGEFILEYVGEVVSDSEFKERMQTIYANDNHHYCLHLDGGLVIDGHRMGGDGRFVNHSCQPNCEMQKWSVNGQFRMALFALRDIEAGEELTYDYNFSLFNPADGQECKCGSEMCRGVIGGKSQRIRPIQENNTKNTNGNNNGGGGGRVGRPRKTEAKKKSNNLKDLTTEQQKQQQTNQLMSQICVKPISHQQKCFILEHHCFLLRNLTKVRKVRDRQLLTTTATTQGQQTATPPTILNHLNALQKPRNIKTRRLAQVDTDPELNKTVKMASILKDIWNKLVNAKDNEQILSTNLMQMPSKRKLPDFYVRLNEPIDFQTIEQNIDNGLYKTPKQFDNDVNKLFNDYIRYYGRTSDNGINILKLKKIYNDIKMESTSKFEDVLGEKPNFFTNKKKNEEEDIIRCICGIPRDEGLMIQCERCLVWQHCECVKADEAAPSYHCEICVPRQVDYEIPLDEYTEHGHQFYMTLMRGDLQLRQGDTVYVLRDIPIPNTDRKHTYETIGKIEFTDLDIFRVERLWKDKDTGKRFAYGHHYLRPHETYHEPTRKFFPNEVMRVPLYEAVPVELIISHCWVMDLNTYCKGRPINAPEEHIYICEYRVDKSARLFSKVSKSKFSICTKSFAFERFEQRLKVSRTYTPHDLDPNLVKPRGRKPQDNEEATVLPAVEVSCVPVVKTAAEQKARLNKILLNLLSKMPTKQVLDISYLLEGGRRRKKQNDTNK